MSALRGRRLLERPRGVAPRVARRDESTPPPAADEPGATSAHRVISLVAAVGLFYPILKSGGEIIAVPSMGLAAILLTALDLGLICAIAAARDEATLERLDRWLLAVGLLTLAAWAGANLAHMAGYSTDEAAFVQSATSLFIHGHDPYGANLLPSLSQYAVPESFWTYTMSGGVVSTFGYPAVPLLVTAPFVALTHDGQAVPIADTVALLVATGLMFAALPRRWRSMAVLVCVGVPVLPGLAIAGDTVIIMVAALTAVAWSWRATGRGGRLGRGGVGRACALGLALATNQLAWFIASFVLVGIYLTRRQELGGRPALGVVARYGAIAATTFLLVDAPFVLWDPEAWLSGILAPLSQHALPYGQGLVGLSVFLRIGGGALSAYSAAAACLFLALLALYALDFRRLARCAFIFPSIALFASGRSLWIYWAALIAVVVVSVATDAPDPVVAEPGARLPAHGRSPARWVRHPVGRAALFVPALTWLALALATPAPLSITVISARSQPVENAVQSLHLLVRNDSARALRPRFATNTTAGQASTFWIVRRGPAVLPAGASATYDLAAPDLSAMPANGSPFLVEAVTASPETISSSSAFTQRGQVPQSW